MKPHASVHLVSKALPFALDCLLKFVGIATYNPRKIELVSSFCTKSAFVTSQYNKDNVYFGSKEQVYLQPIIEETYCLRVGLVTMKQ